MARGLNIEPLTIVMDLEGSDGRERGEVTLFSLISSLSFSLNT